MNNNNNSNNSNNNNNNNKNNKINNIINKQFGFTQVRLSLSKSRQKYLRDTLF